MAPSIPEGYHSVTPMIIVRDARKALDFYQRAFGARERYVMPAPDGKGVMHAEFQIGNSIIMMGEEHPEQACRAAETLGSSPVSFYIYLENVDAAYEVALTAGAEGKMPVQEMFWGDRAGTVQDPFGYSWTLAAHSRDLTMEEIRKGAEAFFAEAAQR